MEFFLHPVTLTLVMSAVLIAMHVVGQIAIANLTPEDAKKWPALAQAIFITVVTAVVAAPTVTNLWAERRDVQNEERARQRDRESQRREVRDVHLERLRPLLLSDSKQLLQLSNQLAIEGTAIGGFLVENYERPIDQTYWYPEILYRDLATHFPDYGTVRERVRGEVLAQQKETLEIQRLASESIKIRPQDGNADGVAVAIVRQCMGTGNGISLEIDATGHYTFNDGGARQTGVGEPPRYVVTALQAYRAFKPTDSFKASCNTLRERAKRLATELRTLAVDAAVAAESPALFGECRYVRMP